ncbi:phosphotransferase family protein [Fusarium sporotrichioides]|uniref:Phosphotransferase family protein n=1 Tax=Fusarium sporotrichioides TaxID=5514 RepID=A0A395RK04_FUSSP|nr:phosphotransferase family protein [Fusarium sporotrichioides]
MSPFISPDQLPQGSSVTFYNSSFFKRGSETPTLPTPSEVLARPNFIQHPHFEGVKLSVPAVFEELGLVVKHHKKPAAIISEGQCLWAVRHFLPDVPVPEVYGWTEENGVAFLYMEYIDGATLEDRWVSLTSTEKEGICRELKTIITNISHLRQAPGDQFIGNINRGSLRDMVFTGTNFPPVGPLSLVTELHDCMSNMFKWPAKARHPNLDLADMIDPYRKLLPDDCPIHFTHADLNPVNIMVSKDSPCRLMAIIDWEQSGWYPAYWEFFKAEMTVKWDSEWRAEYLPKFLDEPDPDCCDAFGSYINSYAP